MPDAGWKAFERRIAKLFHGKRRGPATRKNGRHGNSDIICEGWAPECGISSRPTFSYLMKKVSQSERNAEPGEIPVAIIKRKHVDDKNAMVLFRLETFNEFILNPTQGPFWQALPDPGEPTPPPLHQTESHEDLPQAGSEDSPSLPSGPTEPR